MYKFEDDQQVVPRQSSWFGFHNGTMLLSLPEQDIYKKDFIGLRTLDKAGKLFFLSVPGDHMRLGTDFVRKELCQWLGSD